MLHTRTFLGGMLLLLAVATSVARAEGPTRVACVGDSITKGARVDRETESYPTRLQGLLGDAYEVRNFGVGGATLVKKGRLNIWQALDDVKQFQPHIVVISVGTNDSNSGRPKNWRHNGQFEGDYAELIDTLAALPTKPRIVLCTPTAMVLETERLSAKRLANLTERKPRLQDLCGRIRRLAKKHASKNVSLLELNAVLQGRPELLYQGDGVHPNVDGYLAIAKAVAEHVRALAKKQPNIVLFLVDDMGWQDTSVPFHEKVTPLNRRYKTPNMQRLADAGMKFTQAYACCVCSPTRVSLMTGLNAARHRVTNWTLRFNASNDAKHPTLDFPEWNANGMCPKPGVPRTVHAVALPEVLRQAGYRTIHVGKAHFGAIGTPAANPCNVGFDVNIAGHAAGGPGSYLGTQNFSAVWRNGKQIWDVPGLEAYHGKDIFLTEALTLEANKAVDRAVADHKPFFLYMAHYAVHVPFAEDKRFYQKYLDAGLDPREAMYAAMVEGMDKSLGDILDNVRRHGLADDTIVLFMSDNGGFSASSRARGGQPHTHNRPLSSGKGSAHEGGIRVPMIVKWPNVTKPASTCDQHVIIEDFFPTLLEMAGVKGFGQVGGTIDGVSFAPLLRQEDGYPRDRALYWHFPNNWGPKGPGIGSSSTVRHGDWKLIYYHADGRYELFNLAEDLSERHNLASTKPEMRRRLAKQLHDYLADVGAQMPIEKRTGKPVPLPE